MKCTKRCNRRNIYFFRNLLYYPIGLCSENIGGQHLQVAKHAFLVKCGPCYLFNSRVCMHVQKDWTRGNGKARIDSQKESGSMFLSFILPLIYLNIEMVLSQRDNKSQGDVFFFLWGCSWVVSPSYVRFLSIKTQKKKKTTKNNHALFYSK